MTPVVADFLRRFGLRVPILQAPMAGASPTSLAIAVGNAGGMGGCGALTLAPAEIAAWAASMRAGSNGAFQMNLWVPDPPPRRDPALEARARTFLGAWGPEVPATAGDFQPPDFAAQCEALLAAAPPVVSSIMGLFPASFVAALKARGIVWFATVTTVAEAAAAEQAGADAVVAQGMEAGGHRGCFDPQAGESTQVGLFALVPAVADAVRIPVVASGGIGDGRGLAAALLLGASAVQIGTGFLRCPEVGLTPSWAAAIAATAPERTAVTRAFSGRAGRGVAGAFVRAAADAPVAPYPVQRGLTAGMRAQATLAGDIDRMQAWCGQAGALARAEPAGAVVYRIWQDARTLLGW